MKLCIVTHVVHKCQGGNYYAYGPYISEINLWASFCNEIIVIAPLSLSNEPSSIDLPVKAANITFIPVEEINLKGPVQILKTVLAVPSIFIKLYDGMFKSDHIHLRCPGNMGLLGALAQVLFPKKKKTAKYAGNWDWSAPQPWSYRLQQYILRSTILTRNIEVLVYGDWGETKNIKPFFTASYSKNEIIGNRPRPITGTLRFIFVGTLHDGKRPLLSLEVIQQLIIEGFPCEIHLFGDGPERANLEHFRDNNNLRNSVHIHGNVNAARLKEEYLKSHFLLFASRSEGWPKVVAESMFWGCLPLTTAVSCVPEMLGKGSRGDLVLPNVKQIVDRVKYYIQNPVEYEQKCTNAIDWSRKYTTEYFEEEIKKLLS